MMMRRDGFFFGVRKEGGIGSRKWRRRWRLRRGDGVHGETEVDVELNVRAWVASQRAFGVFLIWWKSFVFV